MKLHNLIFVLLMIGCPLQAQKNVHFTISGYVREDISRESLIGVNIYLTDHKIGTVTNAYGFYSLTLPESDSIGLVISYVGFPSGNIKVSLHKNIELNINLKPSIVLNEVKITADRTERQSESVKMSTLTLQPAQIKNVPSLLGEKDVLKVLQLMPGVQKGSEGSSGFYVRGGGPDQNLIILDDAVVYNASHLFGFFSVFNGDALKSVELIKGGFPARFGELTGPFEPFGNASLYIYENAKEIQFDTVREHYFGSGYNYWIRNFKFKEGQTYNLKVISDIGLEAEATCKIPLRRDFRITVDTSSRKTTDEYGYKISILNAKISITDFPGEANYYRLVYLYETYRSAFPHTKHLSFKDAVEVAVPVWTENNASENDRVSNDVGLDGKKFILRTIEFRPVYLDHQNSVIDSAFLRIYLLNTDKPYYDFHKSLENYSLGDSPFAEPSFLYSNVKGGLGIFASYTLDSLIFRVK